jgi:NAD(P)-dependent dehydrogenase (short-subunit alcohol dehydrogenase family)
MWVIDLNLKSPFWLVQALLPALRRAGTADDPARIINIGSIAAIHVAQSPNYSYASSKAALHQLTRVLARELGPQHVTVNAVAPGPFPSQMMASTLDAIGDTIAAAAPCAGSAATTTWRVSPCFSLAGLVPTSRAPSSR